MFEPFTLPFVQRGLVEIAFLALGAGLIGTWIVLRGLAFHAHAVGTATFPGLVLADGLGFAAPLGALAAAAVFTVGVAIAVRRHRADEEHGAAIALVLVACLAGGVILASDVFASGASVETLLFGSLLLIDGTDIAIAAGAAVLALAGTLLLGRRWLATGFDRDSARAMGVRSPLPDAVLLGLIAVAAVAALSAVGALLATALLVVPAATTRLLVDRLRPWQLATVVLAALEGAAGLWLSVQTDAPPGATIAVVAGAAFAVAALVRVLRVRRAGALVAAAAAMVVAGCGSSGAGGGGEVTVVASTPVAADIARAVGGDRAEVTQLLAANGDPHDYEPRPSDVTEVAGADVVVESGLGLDEWVHDVVDQAGGDAPVVDLGGAVPEPLEPGEDGAHAHDEDAAHAEEEHGHEEEEAHAGEAAAHAADEHAHDHGDVDPHWWHDPIAVIAATEALADALAEADPDGADAYRANAAAYVERLRTLDRQVQRCLGELPEAERVLVTDHDALGYLARRYDIEVVGAIIPSLTTQAQASAGDLAALVETIDERDVRAVFPATSANRRLADTVAEQTGATVGEPLYADTLGAEGSAGATLIGATAHNADAIMRGLTGGDVECAVEAG